VRASTPPRGIATVVRVPGRLAGGRAEVTMNGDTQHMADPIGYQPLPVANESGLAEDGAAVDADGDHPLRVEVIEPRTAGGLGVFLRIGSDSRLTRVAPVRDPRQPRFWCLAAFDCSSCGIPISGDAIWAGFWGSPQSALAELLVTVRKDAAAWLAREECRELRAILLRPRPPLPLPLPRTHHVDVTERAS
jgi:hypothetical protein